MSRSQESIQRLMSGAVRSIAEALHAKDPYTRGHSRRVGDYAATIAAELGLGCDQVEDVRLGGQLHDVGKIGVPDELLHRPGPLTQQELGLIRTHSVIGEQILRPLFLEGRTVLAVVRWHHERVDGRGFPDGLSWTDIPLAARIVAVADAFDAMTTSRPYRAHLSLGIAVRELRHGAGSQFDPRCVRAFITALTRRARTAAMIYFGSWQTPRIRVVVAPLGRPWPYLTWPLARPGRGPPRSRFPPSRSSHLFHSHRSHYFPGHPWSTNGR